jgi:hypothetical protein
VGNQLEDAERIAALIIKQIIIYQIRFSEKILLFCAPYPNKTMKKNIVLVCVIVLGGLCLTLSSCKEKAKPVTTTETEQEDVIITFEETCPYDTFSYPEFDVVASYLAGVLPEDSAMKSRSEFTTSVWKNFSNQFRPRWESYDKNDLGVVKDWAETNLTYTDSLIYPFSGPDFNYLNALFPDTKYALMIALEGVGSAPDIQAMSTDSCAAMLTEMEKSLYFNLKCSFFRTFSMEDELSSNLLDGTMPLILMFMKSHGYELVNVYPVWITEEGTLAADTTGEMFAHTLHKNFTNAASFIYRTPEDSSLRELVYMSLDLSDKGIEENDLALFMENQTSGNTVFMKAASYLCHRPKFHVIRDIILENASQIVADPSGIHYDHYTDDWDLTVHGQYIGPINLFGERVQDNLITHCKEAGNANLPFRFGYHYTHWCMIDAHRK